MNSAWRYDGNSEHTPQTSVAAKPEQIEQPHPTIGWGEYPITPDRPLRRIDAHLAIPLGVGAVALLAAALDTLSS